MSSESLIPIQPMKCLIVDDSRAIIAIIRRVIENSDVLNLKIETAADGDKALRLMDEFHADLVISDWHMPKMSGLEMIQAMQQKGHAKFKFGFITTEKNPVLLNEGVRNGALFILQKPFDDWELKRVVSEAVEEILASQRKAIEPPKTDEGELVPANELTNHIADSLGNIPFRLIAKQTMLYEHLTPLNLLGLYSSKGQAGIYAIAVLDMKAVCMIGGGALRRSPVEVRAAMLSAEPDPAIVAKAGEFLLAISRTLSTTNPNASSPVSLFKESLVKNTFQKLTEVLSSPCRRSDYRLSIPGYGEGHIAFFTVTQ